jgi:hypothetical protein
MSAWLVSYSFRRRKKFTVQAFFFKYFSDNHLKKIKQLMKAVQECAG